MEETIESGDIFVLTVPIPDDFYQSDDVLYSPHDGTVSIQASLIKVDSEVSVSLLTDHSQSPEHLFTVDANAAS